MKMKKLLKKKITMPFSLAILFIDSKKLSIKTMPSYIIVGGRL